MSGSPFIGTAFFVGVPTIVLYRGVNTYGGLFILNRSLVFFLCASYQSAGLVENRQVL